MTAKPGIRAVHYDDFCQGNHHQRRGNRSMSSLLRSIIGCLWAAAFYPSAAVAQEPAKEVLIGYVAPLDDPDAASGAQAAQMAIEETNAAPVRIGNINVSFKLLEQNDKADTRAAERIAHYLAKTEAVAVVGHWTSTTSIVAAPIYTEAGIAQLAPIAWSSLYTQVAGKSHFQGVGSDDLAMYYAVDYLSSSLFLKRVMVIDDSALLGVSMANSFEKYAKKAGMETLRRSVSTQTSDFNSPLLIAKQFRPELILFTGRGAQSAVLAGSMKRLGVSSRLLLTGPVVSPEFLTKINYSDEDLYAIVPGPPKDGNAKIQNFRKRYVARFNREPAPFAMFAYDCTLTLISAIKKADSLDRRRIIASLYEVNYSGLSGVMSFDRDGKLKNPSYTLYQTEKSRWTVRKTIKAPV